MWPLGLLVREHLTGRKLPPTAENVVRHWREFVEARAGKRHRRVEANVCSTRTASRRCRGRFSTDLGLAAEFDDPPELDENDQDTETVDESSDSDSDASPEDVVLDEDSMADEDAEGETSTMQMEADMDLSDLGAESDPDEAPNITRDESGRIRMDVNYQAFTTRIRRDGTCGRAV